MPDRYDKKVLEQIAIAGCLDINKFIESKEKTKEAINYISKELMSVDLIMIEVGKESIQKKKDLYLGVS